MRLGILSDTHGHIGRTRLAVQHLLDQDIDVILHAGDIGSEEVLVEMATLLDPKGISAHLVTGNVDVRNQAILQFPPVAGIHLHHPSARLDIDQIEIAIVHGHDRHDMQRAIDDQIPLLFTGHTHKAADETIASTRILNPGAVYRASVPSVATFELKTKAWRVIPLELNDH